MCFGLDLIGHPSEASVLMQGMVKVVPVVPYLLSIWRLYNCPLVNCLAKEKENTSVTCFKKENKE